MGPNPFSPSPNAFMRMGDITHRCIDLGTLGETYSIAYANNYR